MMYDTLIAILAEEIDRYFSLYVVVVDISDELVKGEHGLVHPVTYNINGIITSLCDLKDAYHFMYQRQVSECVENSRSKIVNLLNELYDKVQLSKSTTKQKIMDCAVKFEKESIAAFKRHSDNDWALILSLSGPLKPVDDVPLNQNTSTLISKWQRFSSLGFSSFLGFSPFLWMMNVCFLMFNLLC